MAMMGMVLGTVVIFLLFLVGDSRRRRSSRDAVVEARICDGEEQKTTYETAGQCPCGAAGVFITAREGVGQPWVTARPCMSLFTGSLVISRL